MTEPRDNTTGRVLCGGWVFYDSACPWCSRTVRLLGEVLRRRDIHTAPLQRGWVQERLGLDPASALLATRLLTADGRILTGADAIAHVAARIWWARPLHALARVPGGKRALRGLYRLASAHRHAAPRLRREAGPR
jgi:predicted DCC family thiol-disulfide oxidoreductase YuxK